jgi:molybdenum cofactor biosynthesis enzyme
MSKVAVKFISDYHSYKKGDVIYVPAIVANKLVSDQVAHYENLPSNGSTIKITKEM